jgi:hypothetical protein
VGGKWKLRVKILRWVVSIRWTVVSCAWAASFLTARPNEKKYFDDFHER